MSYVAQDAFWCRLVQRTKCQCKAVQDSMSWKGMQAKRAKISASVIAGFILADWYGEKTWSGFGTSTWLIQQNSPCEQLAIQENF